MNEKLDKVNALIAGLRLAQVDFDTLLTTKNNLTIELFLADQQRKRTEKQNLVRRRHANLPGIKTVEGFDFGFQKSVSREQILRLSDMTWVEQIFNVCFLGPPGIGNYRKFLFIVDSQIKPGKILTLK